ncbi:MAG: F-box protein [Chlamydiota bacterium]
MLPIPTTTSVFKKDIGADNSLSVLSFLDPQELARSREVSKVWNQFSNATYLWKRMLPELPDQTTGSDIRKLIEGLESDLFKKPYKGKISFLQEKKGLTIENSVSAFASKGPLGGSGVYTCVFLSNPKNTIRIALTHNKEADLSDFTHLWSTKDISTYLTKKSDTEELHILLGDGHEGDLRIESGRTEYGNPDELSEINKLRVSGPGAIFVRSPKEAEYRMQIGLPKPKAGSKEKDIKDTVETILHNRIVELYKEDTLRHSKQTMLLNAIIIPLILAISFGK